MSPARYDWTRCARRGSALLAVLWLSAALAAVAFALSRGVRSEFDRASLNVDSTKAYFLAQGGIEATLRRIARRTDSEHPELSFLDGQRYMTYRFASGTVEVEIIGENGKLDVNQAPPEAIEAVLVAAGVVPARAYAVAAAVDDYRTRLRAGKVSYGRSREQLAAQFGNSDSESTFSPRSTSIQELEELLVVPGVTADLLYGGYRENADGKLVRFGGLADNLTTRGSGVVNANYASREMLLAAGLTPAAADGLAAIQRERPLRPGDPGLPDLASLSGPIRLGSGGSGKAYTLRARAELNGGRARRSIAAVVAAGPADGPDPIRIVRWYDSSW